MVHVLMISQYFPPDINGSSTRAYNVAQGLSSQNVKVTVITTYPHFPESVKPKIIPNGFCSIEKIDNITVIRTKTLNLPHWPLYKRVLLHISFCFSSILALIHVRNIDVIYAMNPSFFVSFPAFIYKIFFRKKIIRNVDDLWPEVFYDMGLIKSRVFKKILDVFSKLSYKTADAITPISDGYVKILTQKYKIPKEKISVIEHGVDINKFYNQKQHSKNKTKIIMYSGAINEGYDFEPVIKAAKKLESYNIKFFIRGNGESVKQLKKSITNNNLTNVEVNTDILDKTKLVKVLSTADMFLLPMAGLAHSGLPTKILEYQALGKPIVCISNGEAGRYILGTKSGLVSTSKNSDDFAKLIIQLLNDEKLSYQLGQNGFDHIQNNLTIDKIGERLLIVIKKIL